MTKKLKISAVSYLNTTPFIYGLKNWGTIDADLILSPPADCAKVFESEDVDIALIPIAALPKFPKANVLPSYCLGAFDKVRTVILTGNTPIEEVKRVFLDRHSLTSVELTKILCEKLWKISPEFVPLEDYSLLDNCEDGDGDIFLLIGDKAFDYEDCMIFSYDLAQEWKELTSLPFVFALWVAREGIDEDTIEEVEQALTFGIEHTYEAIMESEYKECEYAYEYLTENIDYLFDGAKYKSLNLFEEYVSQVGK